MKLERIINADVSENVASERLAAYFARAGYEQITSQPHLTYRRGSELGSWSSPSPMGWKVNAVIQIVPTPSQPTQVTATFDVGTTEFDPSGQSISASERKFWEKELDGLEQAVQTGNVDVSASASEAQVSHKQNLMALVVIVGSMVIFAVGALLIFDSPRVAFGLGGTVGGVLGFLIAQSWLKIRIK